MSSQSFLWINVGLAVLMASLFVIGRARLRAPARLNLRRGAGDRSNNISQIGSSFSDSIMSEEIRKVSGDDGMGIKSLNVIFMYNGHSWDAHEILGVPAGARAQVVRAAYSQALQRSTSESRSFIEAAYRAITASSTPK